MSEFDNELDFLNESLDEPESLEAPKVKKGRGRPKALKVEVNNDNNSEDGNECTPVKPKRQQTEAQKANFAKALAKRQENIALRKAAKELEKQVKEAELETKKKEVERKVLKKAVCLKKKQVLVESSLDELSDCDVPDEVIQKVIKKQKAKAKVVIPVVPVEAPAQKYNFV
jgi:hypothetical protein